MTELRLDRLDRLAAFRHAALRDKDHTPLGGIHVEGRGVYLRAVASDGVLLVCTDLLLSDPALDGYSAVLDPNDVAAASAAFAKRAAPEPADRISVVVTPAADGGLELDLGDPEQMTLLDREAGDDDAPAATYQVRRWTQAAYPDYETLVAKIPDRGSAKPFHVDPDRIAAAAKTAGGERGEPRYLSLAVRGNRPTQTVVMTASTDPLWRGYLATATGLTDDDG